jgi:hypothetical protein
MLVNAKNLDNKCRHLGLPDDIIADIKSSIRQPDRLPYFQLTPIRKPTLKENNTVEGIRCGIVDWYRYSFPMKFHCQSTWYELDVWVN